MKKYIPAFLFMICLVSSCCIGGCKRSGESNLQQSDEGVVYTVVDVLTTGMEFQAPDSVPSGWVTIRYTNRSSMVHMALLERMPEGRGAQEHRDTIAPLFQNIMDQINDKPLSVPGIGTNPPAWMSDIIYIGGPGLLSPGQTVETTMYLIPGTYVLECYVKTNQYFHTYNPDPEIKGMIHELIVTYGLSEMQEPAPTMKVSVSTEGGLEIEGGTSPGEHIVAVDYIDQKVYPNFIQHDVHVARREPGADMDSLMRWINWMNPEGLETPPPSGFTFLGGIHEMPTGSTGYFSLKLEEGEYVFFSEVPRPDTLGLLRVVNIGS